MFFLPLTPMAVLLDQKKVQFWTRIIHSEECSCVLFNIKKERMSRKVCLSGSSTQRQIHKVVCFKSTKLHTMEHKFIKKRNSNRLKTIRHAEHWRENNLDTPWYKSLFWQKKKHSPSMMLPPPYHTIICNFIPFGSGFIWQ